MKRRVLITGGIGYVGGRVAQHLAKREDLQVLLGTRVQTPPPEWLPSAITVQTDWFSDASLKQACAGVDSVLHLAAMNETDCAANPVDALLANGVATARLLQIAVDEGVGRFVYLSTAHVYGSALSGVVTEQTLPRPQHPYATSHRAGEDSVLAAHDYGRIAGCIVRLSNGFGAPAHAGVNRWTLLVNDLCRQAVQQQCLELRSAGLQMRDFVTLHDTARALSHIIDLDPDQLGNGIFNVGGESSRRVIDFVHEIATRCSAVLGFTPDIVIPPNANEAYGNSYKYEIGKIKATGFTLEDRGQAEIDATLQLCHSAFGARQ